MPLDVSTLASTDVADHYWPRSFGDPKAQPQTPRHTPTSATFPSPVLDTPKHYQGSFAEPGGLTPRFAEKYSVFNSTPGNLRGSHGPFADFIPATPSNFSRGHKRLLSAEGPVVDAAEHLSPDLDPSLPPVNPSRSRAPSPSPWADQPEPPATPDPRSNPHLSRSSGPAKKFCKDTHTDPPEPPQIISPPPTSHKAERRLGPKLRMHPDPAFGQSDLTGPTQHDLAVLMGSSGDLFGYPMSAPAVAPANFWDPSMSMGLDLEFNATANHAMQPPTPTSHRHTGYFDWNAEIQLFQDVTVPAPSTGQDTVQQVRRERALAPKPPASEVVTTNTGEAAVHSSVLDDPFGITIPGDSVDPGLVFGRPQTALESNSNPLPHPGSTETAPALPAKDQSGDVRKINNKLARNARLPDRALAGSPIKPSARPGLGRSYSENRGKRAIGRKSLPISVEAGRLTVSGYGVLSGRSGGRPSGRMSPSKTMTRLPSLASIPETCSQNRLRTSVRFTIDSNGRARAETTVIGDESPSDRGIHRSRSSRDVASRSWDSDDSSTDDEPIIIPSRCGSFNKSFALPDSCRPVGSIFHTSCREVSDRSRSNSAHGGESDAETVVDDVQQKGGDATNELRKVVKDRQKWSSRLESARSRRFISTKIGSFPGGIISPTSLTGSSHGPSSQCVRCVCDEVSADEADGFMVQWCVFRGMLSRGA